MERRYDGQQGRTSRYFMSTPVSQRSMFSHSSEITTPEYVNPLNEDRSEFENDTYKENETNLNKTNLRSRFFLLGKSENNSNASPQLSTVNNCAICLESISRQSRSKPLECCHEFCFECLLEWTKVSNACPLCKQVMSGIHELASGSLHVVISPQKQDDEEEEVSSEDDDVSRPYLSDGTDLSGFIVSDGEIDSAEELSLSDNDDELSLLDCDVPALARPRTRRRIYQSSDSESE